MYLFVQKVQKTKNKQATHMETVWELA